MPIFPFRNSVHLTQAEAHSLMLEILSGELGTESIVEILQYFRDKGETVAELVGFASAMREVCRPVHLGSSSQPVIDTCGTGGDGANTFNISTAAAFVIAGAGVAVAKHGNRRISSQCGSADVLEVLGVNVSLSAEEVAYCIHENGIGFLFAPLLHPAVKHAQEARLRMRGRSVFNLLGPLTSPVQAPLQLIGAYSTRAAELMAQASARLGTERAYVVHGQDGLDEISLSGPTVVFFVNEGRVQKGSWAPRDFGIEAAPLEDLQGGDAARNAEILTDIFNGKRGPARDIVVINAAVSLLLAQKTDDVRGGVVMAQESIDSGAALEKLQRLVQVTTERPQTRSAS